MSDMNEQTVPRLVPGKSHEEISEDLKARLREALKPICTIMDEAMGHGFLVEMGLAPTLPYNRVEIVKLVLTRHY